MQYQRLTRGLLALLAAASLIACGGPPGDRAPTLTYAFPDDAPSRASAEALREGFARANPGITITLTPLPSDGYEEALGALLASESPPDLFAHGAHQVPALTRDGALLDLTPYGVATGDISPAALEPWLRDAKLLGLPQRAIPTVMFYNRELFDAAGVPYPADGWDWAAWRETALRLTDPAQGRYGTALGGWDGLVWGNGGEILNPERTRTLLDEEAAAAGVQFGADLINVDRSAPLPEIAGGPDPVALFRDGKLAMLPAPSSLIAALQQTPPAFAWDIAPMPVGRVPATRLTVSGIAASAKTASPEAAARFVAWAGGPEGVAAHIAAFPFAVPPRPSVAPAALLSGQGGPAGGRFVVGALDYGRVQPFVVQWPQINDTINQALVPVWRGQETAAAAYRSVAPTVNQLLAPSA